MQYLLLIYDNEANQAQISDEERPAYMQRWFELTAAMREAGVLLGGEALEAVATATSVRTREGRTMHTDGPFAETKEQLGGFYFIDVENLDEALKWAARIPSSETGTVEVRPVMSYGGE